MSEFHYGSIPNEISMKCHLAISVIPPDAILRKATAIKFTISTKS